MTLYTYNLIKDRRIVDKVTDYTILSPVSIGSTSDVFLTGEMKDRLDYVDPVFLLEVAPAQITACNYLYCPELNRYYFVGNKVAVNNNLFEFQCHEDVLNTYRLQILNSVGFVSRRQTNANPFLPDGSRNITSTVSRSLIQSTNTSHPFDPTFQEVIGSQCFVVSCSNVQTASIPTMPQPATPDPFSVLPNESGTGKGGGVSSYVMNFGQLKTFIAKFYDANVSGDFDSFINSLAGNSLQGINDIIAYPFTILGKGLVIDDGQTPPQEDGTRPIQIYNHTISGQTAYQLKGNACYTVDFGNFTNPAVSFLDLEPYTKATLYLPYVGYVEIPATWLATPQGINIKYKINMYTGDALISIKSNDISAYVKTYTAHIGIHVPLTATNNVEQARNGFTSIIGGLTAMITNPIGGLVTLGQNLIRTGLNTSTVDTGRATSDVSRMACYDPYILIEKAVDETDLTNYGRYIGYPYQKTVTLSSLSGEFATVDKIYNDSLFTTVLSKEMDEIETLLRAGVFL